MGDNSKIEWTDATWNPLRAEVIDGPNKGRIGTHCEKVSEACRLCYAETHNGRMLPGGGTGLPYTRSSRDKVRMCLNLGILAQPLSWRRPRMIFPLSLSDIFGEFVPIECTAAILGVAAMSVQHTFQFLTKRPERMAEIVKQLDPDKVMHAAALTGFPMPPPVVRRRAAEEASKVGYDPDEVVWPPRNIWWGTSIENQRWLTARASHLCQTPGAVRFVSYEPALGPLNNLHYWLNHHDVDEHGQPQCVRCGAKTNKAYRGYPISCWRCSGPIKMRPGVDWVIAGGESGGNDAFPSHPDWYRKVRDQCVAAKVPFFFKQWGQWWPKHPVYGNTDPVDRFECDDEHPNSKWVEHNEVVLQRNGVQPCGMQNDEHWIHHQPDPGENPWWFLSTGKKTAGRLLDGRTWDEMPAKWSVSSGQGSA